jgi:hypothetical protein
MLLGFLRGGLTLKARISGQREPFLPASVYLYKGYGRTLALFRLQSRGHTSPVLTLGDRGFYCGDFTGSGHLRETEPEPEVKLSCNLGLGFRLSLGLDLWPMQLATLGNAGSALFLSVGWAMHASRGA